MFTSPPPAAPQDDVAPVRKFMFDQSFDQLAATARAQERNKPVTMKPEQIEQMKREAYDQGFAAAKIAAQEEETARQTNILTRIDEQLTRMVHGIDTLRHEQESHLRNIILAVAKKLIPNFAARHGLEEIQSMLANVIGEMQHEPRLVVRVHESQLDTINAKLNEISAQKAYNGKIVVLADTEIAAGDCRIEWADGGMERKSSLIWKEVEHIMTPPSSPDNQI